MVRATLKLRIYQCIAEGKKLHNKCDSIELIKHTQLLLCLYVILYQCVCLFDLPLWLGRKQFVNNLWVYKSEDPQPDYS